MVALYVLAAVFAFSVLIICNNFYASSDLLFHKRIPFKTVAMINLLDAPATIVLSLPVASLFGVMLAVGSLGRSSELTAMRCGGISLLRIMIPVLILSVLLSVATYLLDENVVPKASQRAFELKSMIEGDETSLNVKQDIFFRNDAGTIVSTAVYDLDTKGLVRAQLLESSDEQEGWLLAANAPFGRFEGDTLYLNNGLIFLLDEKGELVRRDTFQELTRPFPEELQAVHEEKRDASTLAGGEIAEQVARLQQAGMDPVAEKTEFQFKISTPVACFIFTFVGFIFSVYSPRKETFVGMLYAIIMVLAYYVSISVFKSLGKQGIIPYPIFTAWITNVTFLLFGIYIFTRVRR